MLLSRAFLLMLLLSAGCRRTETAGDWEVFLPVTRSTGTRLALPADPQAPRQLMVRDTGTAGPPLVFVQDRGEWLLLDAEARRVFAARAPGVQDDPQPTRVAAAFHRPADRSVYVLYQQELHAIPLDRPSLSTVAALGGQALCAFPPPFEQHLLQEEDFGEDPDKKVICAVLRDAPLPDMRRACTVAVAPSDGTVRTACTRDDGGQTGRPVEAAACLIQPPLKHPPAASGWRSDETACTIKQDSTGRVVSLLPDADEPAPCLIRFEGMSGDGRFAIWCTADPDSEYTGQKCRVVDLQRNRLLEPAVDLPLETHARWDGTAGAALVGDYLFVLTGSPVKFVELNATAFFVR